MPTIHCPVCRRRLRVGAALAGCTVPCPGCAQKVTLPASFGAETLATSPGRPDGASAAASGDTGPPGGPFSFLHPPERADELGRLGGYRVLRVLGQGGMGVVFEAEDPRLERRVALKVMLPDAAAHPTGRARFLREARAVAALQHDHVIAVYQVGEDNGVPFLVMPLLAGESLDRRLDRERQLPVAEAVRIGREIAEALAAAHARGLIHRDIKPSNVWLEAPHDRVKVLDFGLARAATDEGDNKLTRTGAVLGTPSYMAPEQAEGRADARSDLFSLGCVLYELTTGQRAFDGPSVLAILTCVAAVTPPAPATLNPTVPQALSDLVMALLAKRPQGRPPSAEAVVGQLRTAPADLPIPAARREPVSAPVARPHQRPSPPGAAGGHPTQAPVEGAVLVEPLAETTPCLGHGQHGKGLGGPVPPAYPLPPGGRAPTPPQGLPVARPADPDPVSPADWPPEALPVLPVAEAARRTEVIGSTLKHRNGFVVPNRRGYGDAILAVFDRLGYAFRVRNGGEWVFHRGSKLSVVWRSDIRSLDTSLSVRLTVAPGGAEVRVVCEWEVWTFMSSVTPRDAGVLDEEVRRLEAALRRV
jgi:serine/threonine protein kinase